MKGLWLETVPKGHLKGIRNGFWPGWWFLGQVYLEEPSSPLLPPCTNLTSQPASPAPPHTGLLPGGEPGLSSRCPQSSGDL